MIEHYLRSIEDNKLIDEGVIEKEDKIYLENLDIILRLKITHTEACKNIFNTIKTKLDNENKEYTDLYNEFIISRYLFELCRVLELLKIEDEYTTYDNLTYSIVIKLKELNKLPKIDKDDYSLSKNLTTFSTRLYTDINRDFKDLINTRHELITTHRELYRFIGKSIDNNREYKALEAAKQSLITKFKNIMETLNIRKIFVNINRTASNFIKDEHPVLSKILDPNNT